MSKNFCRRLYPDSKIHGAHLDPVGPRWAPCWPHESCYQGIFSWVEIIFVSRKSFARVHVYIETFKMLHIAESPAYTVSKTKTRKSVSIPNTKWYSSIQTLRTSECNAFVLGQVVHLEFSWNGELHLQTLRSYNFRKLIVCLCNIIPCKYGYIYIYVFRYWATNSAYNPKDLPFLALTDDAFCHTHCQRTDCIGGCFANVASGLQNIPS